MTTTMARRANLEAAHASLMAGWRRLSVPAISLIAVQHSVAAAPLTDSRGDRLTAAVDCRSAAELQAQISPCPARL